MKLKPGLEKSCEDFLVTVQLNVHRCTSFCYLSDCYNDQVTRSTDFCYSVFFWNCSSLSLEKRKTQKYQRFNIILVDSTCWRMLLMGGWLWGLGALLNNIHISNNLIKVFFFKSKCLSYYHFEKDLWFFIHRISYILIQCKKKTSLFPSNLNVYLGKLSFGAGFFWIIFGTTQPAVQPFLTYFLSLFFLIFCIKLSINHWKCKRLIFEKIYFWSLSWV